MATTRHRYNAAIQRAKGILELAAGLYDSSLSFKTTRAAEQMLQTESRLGYVIKLSLNAPPTRENSISLSFATDGFREITAVAERRVSLAWINPAAAATLAFKGTGPFSRRLPIRLVATFPSYNVIGLAVHESLGITSLAQIKKERIPLRLSTGQTARHALTKDTTMFTLSAAMKAAGFAFRTSRKWGGKIQSVARPSHPDRRAAIESGAVNAVFDEGIKSWGRGRRPRISLSAPGWQNHEIPGRDGLPRLRGAQVPVPRHARGCPTLDFSGWPMVVRADMPDNVAYALCKAIEARRDLMPTDNYKPLDVAQLLRQRRGAARTSPSTPGRSAFTGNAAISSRAARGIVCAASRPTRSSQTEARARTESDDEAQHRPDSHHPRRQPAAPGRSARDDPGEGARPSPRHAGVTPPECAPR